MAVLNFSPQTARGAANEDMNIASGVRIVDPADIAGLSRE
jgi:hypothetical protein